VGIGEGSHRDGSMMVRMRARKEAVTRTDWSYEDRGLNIPTSQGIHGGAQVRRDVADFVSMLQFKERIDGEDDWEAATVDEGRYPDAQNARARTGQGVDDCAQAETEFGRNISESV
jgi:hypothetical protein